MSMRRMKSKLYRVIAVLLIAHMVFSPLQSVVVGATESGQNHDLPTSEPDDGVVEIGTAEQLQAINSDLSGSYRLVADIDMGGVDWKPLGTSSLPFSGTLDGNGHEVRNLAVDLPNQNHVGLFGYSKGRLTNVTLQNVNWGTAAGP